MTDEERFVAPLFSVLRAAEDPTTPPKELYALGMGCLDFYEQFTNPMAQWGKVVGRYAAMRGMFNYPGDVAQLESVVRGFRLWLDMESGQPAA
jgi:hypothetical protein